MRAMAAVEREEPGGLSAASRRRALVSATRLEEVLLFVNCPVVTRRLDIEGMP